MTDNFSGIDTTYDMYELIPDSEFELQKPTLLYALEPIGIGTPYVESLTSYLARLAAAHMLSVSSLLRKVIATHISVKRQSLQGTIGQQKIIREMNGMGKEAEAFVETLEQMTGVSNLGHLTMLPFSQMIASKKLLSESSAWCPYCLDEQRKKGGPIYYPLLWNLAYAPQCAVHGTFLRNKCHICGSSSYVISANTVNGYCSECNGWLGYGPMTDTETMNITSSHFFFRVFERHNKYGRTHDEPTFPSMLNYLIGNKLRKPTAYTLSRLLHLSEDLVHCLISKEMFPTVRLVFWISRVFKVDPVDLLTVSGAEMERRDMETIANCDNSVLNPDEIDWPRLHHLLRDVACGKASAMRVEDIARVYKCPLTEIVARYPELCDKISTRCKVLA